MAPLIGTSTVITRRYNPHQMVRAWECSGSPPPGSALARHRLGVRWLATAWEGAGLPTEARSRHIGNSTYSLRCRKRG